LKSADKINADLSGGVNLDTAVTLEANAGLSSPGVQLYGAGFIVTAEEAEQLRALARDDRARRIIHPYLNGRDLMGSSRNVFVLDFFGYDKEDARALHPEAFQRVLDRVKPERDQNRREAIRDKWWRFGWERPVWREAVAGLSRFISTPETAKHRVFVFLDANTLPDNMLTNFALDDAYFLGVLSSCIHVVWSLATGGTLEDRPRYNKTRCFDPFPFPTATEAQQMHIRELAEALDAHRKRQQAQHPKLTLTDCYNVLEKLRAGTPLNAKELLTHEHGLVSVLRQLHDDLDAAVAEAYGLPPTAADEAILTHLCALNARRAVEERAGTIRYLRPAFQNPLSTAEQSTMAAPDVASVPKSTPPVPQSKIPWPKTLAEQAQSVRSALADLIAPASAETIATSFKNANSDRIAELLDTLTSLGHARALPDGTFIAT
jgi:hypothetical protein